MTFTTHMAFFVSNYAVICPPALSNFCVSMQEISFRRLALLSEALHCKARGYGGGQVSQKSYTLMPACFSLFLSLHIVSHLILCAPHHPPQKSLADLPNPPARKSRFPGWRLGWHPPIDLPDASHVPPLGAQAHQSHAQALWLPAMWRSDSVRYRFLSGQWHAERIQHPWYSCAGRTKGSLVSPVSSSEDPQALSLCGHSILIHVYAGE